jgi:hypothetical protein
MIAGIAPRSITACILAIAVLVLVAGALYHSAVAVGIGSH